MSQTPYMPKNFTIACIEGVDQSMTAETCIDRFQISGDGQPLFTITFNYSSDGEQGDVDARVRCLVAGFEPCNLPFISNGIHLIGFVHEFLCNAVQEGGHEFFADAFVCTNGESKSLLIDFGVV